jgi:hypothetical protein
LLGDANMFARTPDGTHVDLTSEQIRPAFSANMFARTPDGAHVDLTSEQIRPAFSADCCHVHDWAVDQIADLFPQPTK